MQTGAKEVYAAKKEPNTAFGAKDTSLLCLSYRKEELM